MSRLKLYWPEDATESSTTGSVPRARIDGGQHVIPFRATACDAMSHRARAGQTLDALVRSQLLRENRACPQCERPLVQPIELNDGIMNRNSMPIPGTATLVGFRCECCGHEWPV